MVAEKGLYAYDVLALVQQVVPNRFDADWRCSRYMQILRATDAEGREIFEAEYYGYDDNGTEEEGDDGHLYFIRWYVLKCGSAQLDDDGDAAGEWLEDRDGDKRFDEDWMDGIDNDGDGRIDEDPGGGWDEDPVDGRDNDGDGRVDEDGPNPVDASQGQVLLYDPDLNMVASWDLQSLLCLEHGTNDGLRASLDGVKHGVLVRVPVSLMEKAGTYYFVLQVWDNHAHLHKDHQVKPALKMNALWKGDRVALVGIEFHALDNNDNERQFPLYSRHLPRDIRIYWSRHLCPDSHPEHGHQKPFYTKATEPPQWLRYLYSTGSWRGKVTLCKYPERVAVPMGWRIRVKADIDANLPTPYVVRIKLTCERMDGWGSKTSSLTFTHPSTGNALSPLLTIRDWDGQDYASLMWNSSPLPS